jgi:dihydroflavonol-4-reductase
MTNQISIAITGSSGHIAASVIPLLNSKGYRVRGLRYKQAPPFNISALETTAGSLSDIASLDKLVDGCEIVIHCAARISLNSNRDPSVYETNVNGTINLFNSAKKANVKRFIHISSIHAYNHLPVDELLNEKSQYCSNKAACYDRSKRDAEQFVLKQSSGKMEVLVLNPTGVVGPFDYKPSLMGKALMNIYNRKIPSLIKGGFDFCDVRDVATAIVNAIDKGRSGESYLLSGKWYSLDEIQRIIMDIKGEKRQLPVVPAFAGYIGLPFTNLLAAIYRQEPLYTKESLYTMIHGNKKISSAKAAEELGYTCRPLQKTIADSISWFKQAGYLV